MKLSVGNLSWPDAEEDWCLKQLRSFEIQAVELAPFKSFGSWGVSKQEVGGYLEKLSGYNLEVSSFQALTYGTHNISLINSPEEVQNLKNHMRQVASILSWANSSYAVFGSPKMRGFTGYNRAGIIKTFNEMGDIFLEKGAYLALETVPEYYGCHFLNKIKDTDCFIDSLNTQGVVRHFDSGCQHLSGDLGLDNDSFINFIQKSKHCHVSEKDLMSFSEPSSYNVTLSHDILRYYQGEWITLEMSMKYFTKEGFIGSLEKFVQLFRE